MPPGRVTPATGRRDDDDDDDVPRPRPLVVYQRKKRRQKPRDAVGSIPEGPLIEILSRLPYPSLCRFNCVSKPWRALCSAPGRVKLDLPPATGRNDDDDDDTAPRPRPLVVYQRRKKRRQQDAEGSIPEGPLIEILSRLPYPSLCRFKCVSKPWRALCSAPDIRKRSPQTLSGFFHNHMYSGRNLRFHNLNGRGPPMVDPALPFLLRAGYTRFRVEQCSTSLLLCICRKKSSPHKHKETDLVVCNPATQEMTVLPPIFLPDDDDPFVPDEAYLGVDASAPSSFVVLVALLARVDDVVIYSSKTGKWIQNKVEDHGAVLATAECVFVNGFMHMVTEDEDIVTVNSENNWNSIALPPDMEPSSGLTSMGSSQGLLHAWYVDTDEENEYKLSVWVLEDYATEDWTIKHSADIQDLFDTIYGARHYEVFAIHPDRNLLFITDSNKTTISYDMDSRQVHVMCNSGEFLGGLPYVPFFGKWLPDGA